MPYGKHVNICSYGLTFPPGVDGFRPSIGE